MKLSATNTGRSIKLMLVCNVIHLIEVQWARDERQVLVKRNENETFIFAENKIRIII